MAERGLPIHTLSLPSLCPLFALTLPSLCPIETQYKFNLNSVDEPLKKGLEVHTVFFLSRKFSFNFHQLNRTAGLIRILEGKMQG